MGDTNDKLQDRLLSILLAGRDKAISGERLSNELGVTRASVWKCIDALRRQGYTVEATTNRGYRVTAVPDLLTREQVLAAVTESAGQQIICIEETDSTNLYANRLILEGASDGTVVIADRQTKGMGRMGRSFLSLPGVGIYLSMILEPHCTAKELGLLTSYAGLAVCRATERVCGIAPQIKWPNDIIIEGKKVCGILTRLVSDAETATITHAIVGIGINVRQQSFPEELSQKAISLRQATGKDFLRAELAGEIINELNRMLRVEKWLENPPENALAQLRALSCTVGKRVTVIGPNGSREGVAMNIDKSGGLLVYFDDVAEVVASGEVSVRGILGYAP